MDAKTVFLTVLIVNLVYGINFDFREKLRNASLTTSTTMKTKIVPGQVIRVPLLDCPEGSKRDQLGRCRSVF